MAIVVPPAAPIATRFEQCGQCGKAITDRGRALNCGFCRGGLAFDLYCGRACVVRHMDEMHAEIRKAMGVPPTPAHCARCSGTGLLTQTEKSPTGRISFGVTSTCPQCSPVSEKAVTAARAAMLAAEIHLFHDDPSVTVLARHMEGFAARPALTDEREAFTAAALVWFEHAADPVLFGKQHDEQHRAEWRAVKAAFDALRGVAK